MLFSHPEMVRDLLIGFVQGEWLDNADFSTLTRVNGSYVTQSDKLAQRHDDLVWKIRINDRQRTLRRAFAIWIKRLLRTQLPDADIDGINELQEVRSMLSENIKSWFDEYKDKGRQEGLQEGRQEGRQEGEVRGLQKGEALALQRLLSKRFGAIPSSITDQIAAASVEQIEAWIDSAIDAHQLTDVFGSAGAKT